MQDLPKICDYSYDERTGGCNCVNCVHHIEHYVPRPTNWYMYHRITAVRNGECEQEKGEPVNG